MKKGLNDAELPFPPIIPLSVNARKTFYPIRYMVPLRDSMIGGFFSKRKQKSPAAPAAELPPAEGWC